MKRIMNAAPTIYIYVLWSMTIMVALVASSGWTMAHSNRIEIQRRGELFSEQDKWNQQIEQRIEKLEPTEIRESE